MDDVRLNVPGIGDFNVEWHLAGDLKSLKCMYNVSHGATSKHPCLYYMKMAKDTTKTTSITREHDDPNWKPLLQYLYKMCIFALSMQK